MPRGALKPEIPMFRGWQGELEAASPTAAEIWQQHKHWCDFTSKVDFQ